jgi:two-component system, LytTR family, sensor kinase
MKKRLCFEQIAGFNDRWLITFGWPVASVLVSLLLFADAYQRLDYQFMAACIPMSFVYTGVFWLGMRRLYSEVKLRYPDHEQIGRRVLWAFLGFNVLYTIVNTVLDGFFAWIGIDHDGEPNQIMEYISSLILSALVITLYEAISFYIMLQRTVAEKEQLQRQNVESQLEGLRNQVNPHFLFNSLNTLTWLIPEDSDKAVRFVQQLSKVYRYVLESRDAKIVSMQEEMEFLKSYTFLLHERFGSNLEVHVGQFPEAKHRCIVPLSLQMLFENAIKHNVISQEKKLRIDVRIEADNLVVSNNIQRKNQVMHSTGVGLENIKDRYLLLTGKDVEIAEKNGHFTVYLPIIDCA